MFSDWTGLDLQGPNNGQLKDYCIGFDFTNTSPLELVDINPVNASFTVGLNHRSTECRSVCSYNPYCMMKSVEYFLSSAGNLAA